MSKLEKNLNTDSIEKMDNVSRKNDIKIEEHLSDEFKNNLVKMMTEEFEKDGKESIKEDSKTNKLKRLFYKNNKNYKNRGGYSFPKRLAILFTVFIIVSGVTFGKNFTNLVAKIFSNQDKSVDLAIENGYYQNIEMDYIFHDGVGIKVDYVYADESCIYIAFNVQTEDEFDEIYIEKIEIEDELRNKIFSNILENEEGYYNIQTKRINKHNCYTIFKFYYNKIIDFKKMYINIDEIQLLNDNEIRVINEKWTFKLTEN